MDGWRTFRTPGGREAEVWCREGTNDAMVAEACIEQDEYRTYRSDATRIADIGGHIGSWSLGYLLDHPEADAVIVEPIPDNMAVIQRNLARNGVLSRAVALPYALAPGISTGIRWNWRNAEGAEMHRYIGGQLMPEGVESDVLEVVATDVPRLLALMGWTRIDLMKIDCEGGEIALSGEGVGTIVGEYHVHRDLIRGILAATHSVTFEGQDTFGSFRAVAL